MNNLNIVATGNYLSRNDSLCTLFEYSPTIFSLLYGNLDHIRFVRRIRLLLEYLRPKSYKVYYLQIDGNMVGYCVVTPGGRRLKCSTKQDVVFGPYFICEEFRGKGYSKILLQHTLQYCTYPYKYVYDWIDEENKASIRASEAVGFKLVGRLSVVGIMRKLIVTENGNHLIYRCENNKQPESKDSSILQ